MTLQVLQVLTGLMGLQPLDSRATFAAVLQLFCPAALLPGLLRCLCRLLLPFWACTAFVICCLACSAAFVYFYCLSGHGRLCLLRCLCRLLLPFWAFTAFVDLLPGLLRYTDFDYWMSQLAYLINYFALQLALRIHTNFCPCIGTGLI